MKLWAFVRHCWCNYVYQRQQLGAPRIVAVWDALCDTSAIWWLRRSNAM